MNRRIWHFIIFIFLMNAGIFAQTENQPLTLQKALELGQQNNLTLKQQQDRIRQAVAEMDAQKADFLPVLFLNGSYSYTSKLARFRMPITIPGIQIPEIQAGVKNQYDMNASIQQPLFTGFRISNQYKSARENMQQTQEQEKVARNQILLQIHKIYYAAQLNRLQQKVMQSGLERAQDHLQTAVNFLQAAQTTPLDTLKVANQVLNLQTQLKKLEYSQKVILTQLARVLNVEEIGEIEPFSTEDISLSIEDLSSLKQQAMQNRPELSQVKHQIRAQEFRKDMVRSRYFPQIFARASYHYGRPGVNFFKDEWINFYQLGVSLQWELWNWGSTRNQVRQAEYAVHTFNLQQQNLLTSIRQEVTEAYQNLLSDREQIRMTKQLVVQEKERYRVTREKFDQGLATNIDLSDSEDSLTAAELQLQQSYIGWFQNKAQMLYATGNIEAK